MVGSVVSWAGGYSKEVVVGHGGAVDDARNESDSESESEIRRVASIGSRI